MRHGRVKSQVTKVLVLEYTGKKKSKLYTTYLNLNTLFLQFRSLLNVCQYIVTDSRPYYTTVENFNKNPLWRCTQIVEKGSVGK